MFLLRLTNIRLPTVHVRLLFIKFLTPIFYTWWSHIYTVENLSICSHLILYTLSLFEKETCIILWDLHVNKSFLYDITIWNWIKVPLSFRLWLQASCQTLDTFGEAIIRKQCLLRRLSFLTGSSRSFATHAAEPMRACSQAKANVQSLCVYLFHPHVNNIIHYCKQIYFPINGLQSE